MEIHFLDTASVLSSWDFLNHYNHDSLANCHRTIKFLSNIQYKNMLAQIFILVYIQ